MYNSYETDVNTSWLFFNQYVCSDFSRGAKMQDRNMIDQIPGVENAGSSK